MKKILSAKNNQIFFIIKIMKIIILKYRIKLILINLKKEQILKIMKILNYKNNSIIIQNSLIIVQNKKYYKLKKKIKIILTNLRTIQEILQNKFQEKKNSNKQRKI